MTEKAKPETEPRTPAGVEPIRIEGKTIFTPTPGGPTWHTFEPTGPTVNTWAWIQARQAVLRGSEGMPRWDRRRRHRGRPRSH